jgi:hypothetical protein
MPRNNARADPRVETAVGFLKRCAEHMPHVLSQFGWEEERSWPVTLGQNERGRMDEVEFDKYQLNSIILLYLDVKNMPGHRVLLKVDSGPGRMNIRLLLTLRHLSFIL